MAKFQWEKREDGGDVNYIEMEWHGERPKIDDAWLKLLERVGRGFQAQGGIGDGKTG